VGNPALVQTAHGFPVTVTAIYGAAAKDWCMFIAVVVAHPRERGALVSSEVVQWLWRTPVAKLTGRQPLLAHRAAARRYCVSTPREKSNNDP
jgi:hypothetical protein